MSADSQKAHKTMTMQNRTIDNMDNYDILENVFHKGAFSP